MRHFPAKRYIVRPALALLLLFSTALTSAAPAAADSTTAQIAVIATNSGKLTLTLSDVYANFGQNIDPTCTASNAANDVVVGLPSTLGCYYAWEGDNGPPPTPPGPGLEVTVRTSQTWVGTIQASENGGTSSTITIANGSLRWGTSIPATYA